MKCMYKIITLACMFLATGLLYPVEYAYVINSGSDDVSLVNRETRNTVDTIEAGNDPGAIAITPDQTKAYVANYDGGSGTTVTSIDMLTDTPDPTLITVSAGPLAIAMAETQFGLRAYVVGQSGKSIIPIQVDTNTPLSNIDFAPGTPQTIAIKPYITTATTAYVGSSDSVGDNYIYPVDLTQDPAVVQTGIGPLLYNPFWLAITPDGNTLIATDLGTYLGGGTVIIVSDLTGTPTVTTLSGPGFYTYVVVHPTDSTKAYLSGADGSITPIVNLGTTPSLETAIPLPGAGVLFGMALTADGTEGYVVDYTNNELIPLAITSTSITAGSAIPVGTSPRHLALFSRVPSVTSTNATQSKNIYLNKTNEVFTLAANPFSLSGNVLYQLYNNSVLIAATRKVNPLLFEVGVSLTLPLNLTVKATAADGTTETATITVTE